MREWLRRAEFREALPLLLPGEDPDLTATSSGWRTPNAPRAAEADAKKAARGGGRKKGRSRRRAAGK